MIDWRAIGGGLLVFSTVFGIALCGVLSRRGGIAFWAVLAAGIPAALVTGYLKGGLLAGSLYGLATGCGIVVLMTSGFFYSFTLSRSGAAIGLLILLLLDALFLLESVVFGAIGGVLASSRLLRGAVTED